VSVLFVLGSVLFQSCLSVFSVWFALSVSLVSSGLSLVSVLSQSSPSLYQSCLSLVSSKCQSGLFWSQSDQFWRQSLSVWRESGQGLEFFQSVFKALRSVELCLCLLCSAEQTCSSVLVLSLKTI
jgi:hypothetical protein